MVNYSISTFKSVSTTDCFYKVMPFAQRVLFFYSLGLCLIAVFPLNLEFTAPQCHNFFRFSPPLIQRLADSTINR